MSKPVVTKRVLADLAKVGIALPAGFEVVDDNEADSEAQAVVCGDGWEAMPPFLDNIRTTCCICGAKVQHRPNVPPAPKICMRCAITVTP